MLTHRARKRATTMATDEIDLLEVQRNLERRREQLEASEGPLRRGDHGFRQIGILVPKVASSPGSSGSTPTPSSPSSATTGPTSPGRAVAASPGSGPGKTVAATVPKLAAVREAVLAQDSDLVAHRLQAWLRPFETSLRPSISEDGNPATDWEITGYRLVGPLPAKMLADLEPVMQRLTAPAGPQAVLAPALRCLTLTKSRERDGMDLRLFAAALAEELGEFPVDVVATAFRRWARRETWWPSLAEIREQCLREMRWRNSLKAARGKAAQQLGAA